MARIRTYANDTTLTGTDRLLGTDADGNLNTTRNFTLSALKDFINDGTTERIGERIPLGFGLVVDQAGEDLERSLFRQLDDVSEESDVVIIGSGATAGVSPFLARLGNGQAYLTFRDANDGSFAFDYDFNSLVGVSWSGSIGNNTYTGTISSFRQPDFESENFEDGETRYRTENGQIVTDWVFFTSLNENYSGGFQDFTELTVATADGDTIDRIESQIIGRLNTTGELSGEELTIRGSVGLGTAYSSTNQFRIDIGSSDNPGIETHLHGTLNFDEVNDGIVFGPHESDSDMSSTTLTLDTSGNVIVQGENDPDWIFRNSVELEITGPTRIDNLTVGRDETSDGADDYVAGSITIIDADGNTNTITAGGQSLESADGNPLPGPAIVAGNPTSTAGLMNQGTLNSLRVGSDLFNLPELTSGVAAALPGLNEELGGPEAAITIGDFFYGEEQSGGAIFRASVTDPLGTDVSLAIGDTSATIDAGDATAFGNAFDNAPDNQLLFFVASTYDLSTASDGEVIPDTITGGLYEVLTFNTTNNAVTFGRLGSGQLNIGTGSFSVTSETVLLPEIPARTTETDFVYYDTSDGSLAHAPLTVSGRANGARLVSDDGATVDEAVTSIAFTGNNAATTRTAGALSVDISGRYTPVTLTASPTNVNAFNLFVLRPIATPQNILLPTGQVGDSIKFVNTSTIADDGTATTSAGTWSITPNTGQDIMGDPPENPLILNDPTASFELVYAGGVMGWVIIGIN